MQKSKINMKFLKLKIKYWLNKNNNMPLFYNNKEEDRQNGKTELVIKDAIKHHYPIVVSSYFSKNCIRKRLKDKGINPNDIIIIVPDYSKILNIPYGTKILIDGDMLSYNFVLNNRWKIVNGFVYNPSKGK